MFVLALTLLLSLFLGCKQGGTPAVDTVVVISIDTLRADHVGAYGYEFPTTPTIDSLAGKGLRFDRAYATSSWTLPSHAALLSGYFDEGHGAIDSDRAIATGVPLLAKVLNDAGVHTAGFYSGPFLDPSFGFSRGFDEYIDATSAAWQAPGSQLPAGSSSQDDVTNPILKQKVRAWVESHKLDGRSFIFIHMWDVHYDFIAPESYVRLFDPEYTGTLDGRDFAHNPAVRPDMPPRELQHLLALYDAEIRYTDDTLAEILSMLRGANMLNNAAIIVTADHGEEFFEHGHKGHRWTLFEEVIHVPLVIYLTGETPTAPSTAAIVSLVDVYPTVCDLLQVSCNYEGPGFSLLPLYRGHGSAGSREGTMAELTTRMYGLDKDALIRPSDKLIRWNRNGALRYYRMSESRPERGALDPATLESRPPELASALEQLDAWIAQSEAAGRRMGVGHQPAVELNETLRSKLRSLGYVE